MRRHVQILTILTALAAPCCIAQAQTLTAGKIDDINKATESFLALAKESGTTGKPPRYADPAAKPLLDTVLNTKDIEGKTVPWSSMELLQNWNKAVVKIGLAYFLAGTGTTDVAIVSKDPDKIQKTNSNSIAFANEVGRVYDAQLRIYAAMIDTAATQLAAASPDQLKDPAFKNTLNNLSDNTARMLTGLLGTFVLEGLPEDWQLFRLVVLLDLTPKAAKFMAPEDRRQVRNAAAEVAGLVKNPDVRSGTSAVARAFELL